MRCVAEALKRSADAEGGDIVRLDKEADFRVGVFHA
jgi:hypothetical protein